MHTQLWCSLRSTQVTPKLGSVSANQGCLPVDVAGALPQHLGTLPGVFISLAVDCGIHEGSGVAVVGMGPAVPEPGYNWCSVNICALEKWLQDAF